LTVRRHQFLVCWHHFCGSRWLLYTGRHFRAAHAGAGKQRQSGENSPLPSGI